MDCIECRIGNKDVYLPVGDKLYSFLMKTNYKVNYFKRVAKMRKAYRGEIYDNIVILSPTFIYALEEVLDEQGYSNVFHNIVLSFSNKEQQIFSTLLRDGKSFRYVSYKQKIPFKESLLAIQALFAKLSLGIK